MNITIAGDFCPRGRMADLSNKDKYDYILGDVKKVLCNSDYSIVNLECPVVRGEASPISKCGPNLRCTEAGIEALKWAGFDCVTLANNHFLDYGVDGVSDTLDTVRNNKLDYVGGGINLFDASLVLYKIIGDGLVAIINCCEHEFSIATPNTAGSNPLNPIQQYYTIQEARKKADYVIVIVHGGVELFWLPSKRMIETYRFFIDAGADAVISHHQHCYNGYEIYKGKPIFYGLGNFCFDGHKDDYRWTSGFMVQLDLSSPDSVPFELLPYRQCSDEPRVRIIEGGEREAFLEQIKEYNDIISQDDLREMEYKKWCQERKGMYSFVLNPSKNRYNKWFFKTPLGRVSKKKLLQLLDYLVNESHIERVRMLVEEECTKIK